MTNHKTSVVHTNKHLLLPKSLGASADLDRLGWPWPGSSFSAVSCGLRGQCQLSYGSPHLPGCRAGLVLRATAGSPQRAEVCEGLWSLVWELVASLPPFINQTSVEGYLQKWPQWLPALHPGPLLGWAGWAGD